MFRSPAGVARALPKRWPVRRRFMRLASTSSPEGSAKSSSYAWAAAGLVGAAASGVYVLGRGDRQAPRVATDGDVPISSPVKVLDRAAADKKLREQVHSFGFASVNGAAGRVDVVRVPSNHPVEDEWAVNVAKGVGGRETLFAGVYDGHAGWATSAVLKQALIPYVSSALAGLSPDSKTDAVDAAIKTAFTRLDDGILDKAEAAVKDGPPASAEALAALAPAMAGSCALLTMFDPQTSQLRTAVTGDSRAVRGAWSASTAGYSADVLSEDQTGFNEAEVRRLEAEHPGETADIIDPKTGRLMGIAITRAFGDHRWKWSTSLLEAAKQGFWGYAPRPKAKTPPYMTARPEVTQRTVAARDFVILASDGLWDVMSNDDAVACVARWLKANKAGRPETTEDKPTELDVDEDGWASWKATPDDFAIEDLDNAAVCLARNAMGGRRRELVRGVMTVGAPLSRYVRDDVTIQVIFFERP